MDNLIKQTTLRELLSYKVFADPNNQTSQLRVRSVPPGFRLGRRGDAVERSKPAVALRTRRSTPPWRARPARRTAGAAGRPDLDRRRRQYGGGYGRTGGGGGMRLNFRMMTENDRKIVEEVCADKARVAKVYANPVDIGGYAYWSDWKFEKWDKAIRMLVLADRLLDSRRRHRHDPADEQGLGERPDLAGQAADGRAVHAVPVGALHAAAGGAACRTYPRTSRRRPTSRVSATP